MGSFGNESARRVDVDEGRHVAMAQRTGTYYGLEGSSVKRRVASRNRRRSRRRRGAVTKAPKSKLLAFMRISCGDSVLSFRATRFRPVLLLVDSSSSRSTSRRWGCCAGTRPGVHREPGAGDGDGRTDRHVGKTHTHTQPLGSRQQNALSPAGMGTGELTADGRRGPEVCQQVHVCRLHVVY